MNVIKEVLDSRQFSRFGRLVSPRKPLERAAKSEAIRRKVTIEDARKELKKVQQDLRSPSKRKKLTSSFLTPERFMSKKGSESEPYELPLIFTPEPKRIVKTDEIKPHKARSSKIILPSCIESHSLKCSYPHKPSPNTTVEVSQLLERSIDRRIRSPPSFLADLGSVSFDKQSTRKFLPLVQASENRFANFKIREMDKFRKSPAFDFGKTSVRPNYIKKTGVGFYNPSYHLTKQRPSPVLDFGKATPKLSCSPILDTPENPERFLNDYLMNKKYLKN